MSNHSFEVPWNDTNPLLENTPKNPVICELVCQLEKLLQERKKNSCPSDDMDIRILSAIECAMNNVKLLIEKQDLTDQQKRYLVKKSRLMIKEASNVIEKSLKLRSH
ncbi:uncharacterized protein LOC112690963 [Sipha flava]|jgi:hypothetical protein|uniref:Uncharacterized protein LOC112690963 n=1 Tax=Sipha flava TaxID=143950 RepID=A0A8B8GDW0_9HEMI|nr:uncharacterized protein LOC112690963 [Sipha flava]